MTFTSTERYVQNLLLRTKGACSKRHGIRQPAADESLFKLSTQDFTFSALISQKSGKAIAFSFATDSSVLEALLETFCEMAQGISIREYWVDALIRTEEALRGEAGDSVPGLLVPLRYPSLFAPLREILGAFRLWLESQESLLEHRRWQARPVSLEDLAKEHDLSLLEEKIANLVENFSQQKAPRRALRFAGLQAGPRALIQIQDSASIAETGHILLALERHLRRHALAGLEVISDTWNDKNRRNQPRSWQVKPAAEISGE